ncbi:MAG: adenosine kinase [Rhodobacteraceae bacterium]|nr:adenosine kinase [Paracoccaceae bacterium]
MKKYQVVGIGNALVDILAHCEDAFLADSGVEKGIMQLIDADRAAALYARMGPAREISGGSAANTIAGIASLGGRTAYVGKVKDDQRGYIFARDIRAQGTDFETPFAPGDEKHGTGCCMVLVTPDAERSMSTYLGVSEQLGPGDIDPAWMAAADWIYLEGYRFDGAAGHAAFARAIGVCKGAGGKVSVTLSDPFCVQRHRDAFRDMIRDYVDLLFCNEHEVIALYQTDDLQAAVDQAATEVEIVACTMGPKGVIVCKNGTQTTVPAEAAEVVDVTGAGDLFAAGFLYGLATGRDPKTCGRMGNIAAGEAISHIGARPAQDLSVLFRAAGIA